ncbi:PQQ-dependent sugar dehydrogenase [Falsiroseomonas oryzae]|uniref:PQQ-dependent sugar dehydrogenase n=1 Tax=Falsiroseomonas oryzae TaxID=2766473 RepID=UPI0022EA81E1|nr:PQQ-dependent sugar dehydrogenase [Roseomonas sp. MO-31]
MRAIRAALVGGLLLLGGMAHAQPVVSEAPPAAVAGVRVVTLVENLARPWALAFLPDGSMLFTERRGQIRLVRDGQLDPRPIAGVPPVWIAGSAQHLAGMADLVLHPDFARNRTLFFSYAHGTHEANRTRLARAVLDLEAHALRDVRVIFEGHPEKVSYGAFGSRIAFLPDGTILFAVGDGGDQPLGQDGRMVRENAQDLATNMGKIVRIAEDGGVPRDNPFVGQANARPEIYALGSRNSQGLAFDPIRRMAWFTDHGAQGGDELNRLEAGRNYGWPVVTHSVEYTTNARIGTGTGAPGMTDPVIVWPRAVAPSGLLVYTGNRFPAWRGDLFSGGLMSQDIRRIRLDPRGRVLGEERIPVGDRVRDVRQGPDGLLYLVTDRSARGRIMRVEPN